MSGQSPLVDVTNPATTVDMSSESLEILPTNRDGLKAFMGTMPGVRTNLDVGASSMSDTVQFRSYGQSGQSWQMLEGIMFSTPNAGGANGSHIDFNALDSTRVQTVGSSAEMPRRGIMLDAVMKSGGNEFHGEAVAYGSSGAFESTNMSRRVEGGRRHRRARAAQALGYQRERWAAGSSRTSCGSSPPSGNTGFDREIFDAFYTDGSPMLNQRRLPYWSGKAFLSAEPVAEIRRASITTRRSSSTGAAAGSCRPSRAKSTKGRSPPGAAAGRRCTGTRS